MLIATNDPTVQIVKQDKQTKSDVWSNDQYRMIYRDGVRQNFALCTECQALITHKSCYGTGGLLRHRCFRKRNGLMQTHGRGRRTRKAGSSHGAPTTTTSTLTRRQRRSSRQRLAARSSMAATTASTASSSSSPLPALGTETAHAEGAEDTLTQIRYELETLLQHSDATVELLKPPAGSRSLVWTYNLLQMVYRDGERQDFVFCVECRQLLVHRVQAGTNRLLRHPCIQAAIERLERAEQPRQHGQQAPPQAVDVEMHQQEEEEDDDDGERSQYDTKTEPIECADIENTASTYISPFMTLPDETAAADAATGIDADKKTIAKQQLYLMSREFIPAALLGDGGNSDSAYQRLLQCLLSSAVGFGRFNATQCWLDATDVQHRLTQRRATLHERLKRIVATEKLSFSCDVWQHRPDQVCVTLHGHYVDDAYRLRNVVLGTRVHREEAGDLFELCVQILRKYVGDSKRTALRTLSNATIVVDGDRNRNGMQRMINCVASGLNGIATELIADSTVVQQICATVCAKLSAHASPEIRAMLLRFDGTRWETIWNLLTVYREIVGTVECPHEIDDILAMLDPLHEVSSCLGRFVAQTPTINLVYPFRQKLLDVFASALDATTLAIKQKFLASIKSNFVLTDLHRIAVFLDPRFKSLRFFSADERARIVDMTKVLISDGTEPGGRNSSGGAHHHQPVHAYLADYMDDGIGEAPSANEVDAYLRMQLNGTLRVADDDQVLAFWQQRDDLPRLQNLVRQILCIPASCTADGCHFAAEAERVVEMRARMEVGELDAAMLVVCNKDV